MILETTLALSFIMILNTVFKYYRDGGFKVVIVHLKIKYFMSTLIQDIHFGKID